MCNLFYEMTPKAMLKNAWYYIRFYAMAYFSNYFNRDRNNSLEKRGYSVVFNDEFDQPINWNIWRSCEQWGCDRGNIIFKQSQVTQSDSSVIMTSEMNDVPNEAPVKTGGLFSWNFLNLKYGYFETREKLSPGGVKYWPAFWLSGTDTWPPEIDVFELMDENSSSYFTMTLHWRNTWTNATEIQKIYDQIYAVYGYVGTDVDETVLYLQQPEWTQQKQDFIDALWAQCENEQKGRKLKFPKKDYLSKAYHTYACEWTKDKVVWYIDNLAVYVLDKHIPDRNMLVLINNSSTPYDAPNPSDFPMSIYCDYIRVYKKD